MWWGFRGSRISGSCDISEEQIFMYLITPSPFFIEGAFTVKSPFNIYLMRAVQFKLLYFIDSTLFILAWLQYIRGYWIIVIVLINSSTKINIIYLKLIEYKKLVWLNNYITILLLFNRKTKILGLYNLLT
jgi:hypothetical protein